MPFSEVVRVSAAIIDGIDGKGSKAKLDGQLDDVYCKRRACSALAVLRLRRLFMRLLTVDTRRVRMALAQAAIAVAATVATCVVFPAAKASMETGGFVTFTLMP